MKPGDQFKGIAIIWAMNGGPEQWHWRWKEMVKFKIYFEGKAKRTGW